MAPAGTSFTQDENRRGAVGVGGVRTLTFNVTGPGEGDLEFVNARPWELQPMIEAGKDISD